MSYSTVQSGPGHGIQGTPPRPTMVVHTNSPTPAYAPTSAPPTAYLQQPTSTPVSSYMQGPTTTVSSYLQGPTASGVMVSSQGAMMAAPNAGVVGAMQGGMVVAAGASQPGMVGTPGRVTYAGADVKVLDKKRLQELVKEVDPLEQLDEDVEEMLLQIADDFIDNVVTSSCQIAKHRKANTVEVKDVQLHLERNWNMWIPGFGSDELKPFKKASTTEAHKQRMALIKKTLKKY